VLIKCDKTDVILSAIQLEANLYVNFGESVIEWVKTFYKDITSAVTQNCSLSEFFNVQRGFRQGDPLPPYIFLLCAEILGILVKKSWEIKDITIDDTEYRLSQMLFSISISKSIPGMSFSSVKCNIS
jgi:hypothetical protein